MTLVACGLLALGVLAFMISPMLEGSARRPWIARSAWTARSRRDDLLKKKDFIYSSIRELNIDYNMGKLAAEDHETLRQEYMREASDVLDELDRTVGTDLSAGEQIEEAVLEIRRSRDSESAAGAAVVDPDAVAANESEAIPADEDRKADDDQAAGTAGNRPCARCGTINEESANFCIECGVSLKRITCGGCGSENPAAARFCGQCGVKLT